MRNVAVGQIRAFLEELDRQYHKPASIYLLGGSALCLIGGTRPTVDIDYVGDDLNKNDFQRVIDQVASELNIEVEAVPIDRFVPIPNGATERHLFVDRFGQIDVYILDPYTIALSKLDRGFDTDIEDIVFLIRQGIVTISLLETIVVNALVRARDFDMTPSAIRTHLQIVRYRIEGS